MGSDIAQTRDASSHDKTRKKKKKDRSNKKRPLSPDGDHQSTFDRDALHVEDDPNEPTMGEKLATLNLLDVDKTQVSEKDTASLVTKPPSADSVHVLLRQALNADDRVLVLDCLHTRDEKVIANSVSLLSPSDVLRLLNSLTSLVQSRGAVLVCALPWLKSLLIQHASAIMSQESSILALSSLYQLIESRVSTFQSALQLSSILDYHFAGIHDNSDDELDTAPPTIYEGTDESDEDELDAASETDHDSDGPPPLNGFSDLDASDGMSEFASNQFRELCEKNDNYRRMTTPYSPQ